MTEDELERRLREHFAAHARGLPEHVARAVAEEVPRRQQMSPGFAWLGQARRFALAAGIAAVVLLSIVAGPSLLGRFPLGPGASATAPSTALPPSTMTWDAVLNFRGSPQQLNPSPDVYGHPNVWSYLEVAAGTHDPTAAARLREFDPAPRDAWVDSRYPGLAIGTPIGDALTIETFGAGPTNRRAAVVAWRSPVEATVSIVGRVEVDASCGDGVSVWIDLGADSLEAFDLARGQRQLDLRVDVNVGDTLYVGVEPGTNGDAACDTTWLMLTIQA
jgi:hypothetical protein